MRLIDADWVLEHRLKELSSYDTYDLEEMLKCVPTVEQKYGHWERFVYNATDGLFLRCDEMFLLWIDSK